jgi:hypothetical protein
MTAALGTAAGATLLEELVSGPGASALRDAADSVLQVSAVVSVIAALPLLPLLRRRGGQEQEAGASAPA